MTDLNKPHIGMPSRFGVLDEVELVAEGIYFVEGNDEEGFMVSKTIYESQLSAKAKEISGLDTHSQEGEDYYIFFAEIEDYVLVNEIEAVRSWFLDMYRDHELDERIAKALSQSHPDYFEEHGKSFTYVAKIGQYQDKKTTAESQRTVTFEAKCDQEAISHACSLIQTGHPFMHEKLDQLLLEKPTNQFFMRGKYLLSDAKSIEEMVTILRDAAQKLENMNADGFTLDSAEDDYIYISTDDPEMAKHYGLSECLVIK